MPLYIRTIHGNILIDTRLQTLRCKEKTELSQLIKTKHFTQLDRMFKFEAKLFSNK